MNERIKKACRNKELIGIQLKNDSADDYLVGIIETYDENGIVLCNVDYRGLKTAYIYLAIDKILSIPEMPCYLEKISILMKKQKEGKEYLDLLNGVGLKKAFLKWIYDKHKLFWIRFEDEEIRGFICSLSETIVNIEVMYEIAGEKNGHTLLLTSHMNYLGINFNDNVLFSQCDKNFSD